MFEQSLNSILWFIINYVVARILTLQMLDQNAFSNHVNSALEKVKAELSKNPYADVLSYRSTQTSQFITDDQQNLVNKYQKPIGLYLRLLKMFAMPGALVLDATMGTGSLELAAMEPDAPSKLNFLSVERNSYQHLEARKRLERSCVLPTAPNLCQLDAQEELHGDEM